MVISKLQGGLGNQLFEYAASKMFANQLETSLKLETSYYYLVRNRSFVLPKLGIEGKSVVLPLFLPLNIVQLETAWEILITRLQIYGLTSVRESSQFAFQPRLDVQNRKVFLQGFWQHRAYADAVGKEIRSAIISSRDACSEIKLLLAQIESTNSVAIHIRRTDYVTSNAFEPCSIEYYQRAIMKCHQQHKSMQFFVCSDDVDWVKSNLDLPKDAIFISGTGLEDWQEFLLLSACKHMIMANSTFSWWAAWVGGVHNRIVIMPKKWSITNTKASEALHYPERQQV